MAITILFLRSKGKTILISVFLLILFYPMLIIVFDYETAWNFNSLEYQDFWTISGFLRNLFFNGFHPVIPWTAFMLMGYWYGKQDLSNDKFVKKSFWVSSIIFIFIQISSHLSISFLSEGNPELINELTEIIGTNPMPPLPIYMFNGIAVAIAVISACILIAKRFPNNSIIDALNKTGQLALTFYVAHVIIGMGIIEAIKPIEINGYSIEFSISYALVFSLFCVLFAVTWLKYNKTGPLEWVMRKLTD